MQYSTDVAVISPIDDETCSNDYPLESNQGNSNDFHFTSQTNPGGGNLKAFEREISTKEDCHQYLLQESVKAEVLEISNSAMSMAVC